MFRVSSKRQLDLPSVHAIARQRLEEMYPSSPHALIHRNDADQALDLAIEYNIYSVRLLFD